MVTSVALFARTKLAGSVSELTPSNRLAARVIDYEQRVKVALLSGLIAADVGYQGGDHSRHRASRRRSHADSSKDHVADELLHYQNGGPDANQGGNLTEIGNYYRHLRERGSSRLVILGQPGSGKTMLAVELILQLLREDPEASQLTGTGGKVPVRFNAANWTTGTKLEDWLAERLTATYAVEPVEAQALIASRKVLPVLDGLDEMDPDLTGKPETGNRGMPRATAFLKELNAYADIGQPGPMVLTCRTEVYNRLRGIGSVLAACQEVTILDLDAARIRDYLHERYEHPAHPQRKAWDRVLTQLGKPEGAAARVVLSTPWRLLLTITAAEGGRDPSQLLAVGVGEAPQAAAERIDLDLLGEYITAAARLTALRSRSGIRGKYYKQKKVTRWMRHLALHLEWQDGLVKYVAEPAKEQTGVRGGRGGLPVGMSGVDLVPHLLWQIGGFSLVRGLHTALQFILATTAAVALAYAVIGPPAVWVNNIHLVLNGAYDLPSSIGKTIGAFGFLTVVVSAAYVASYPWPPPRYSAPNRTPILGRLTIGLVLGLGAGLGVGLGFGALGELAVGHFRIGFVFGFLLGFAIVIPSMLAGESWDPEADIAEPYEALSRDRLAGFAAAIMMALALGVAVGLGYWRQNGLIAGLIAAFMLTLVTWSLTARVSVRYAIGMICAASRQRLPIRLKRFMAWSCDSGLLRGAGPTYQFRHRELQNWLNQSTGNQRIHAD
jgi:hypothetical protein